MQRHCLKKKKKALQDAPVKTFLNWLQRGRIIPRPFQLEQLRPRGEVSSMVVKQSWGKKERKRDFKVETSVQQTPLRQAESNQSGTFAWLVFLTEQNCFQYWTADLLCK